MSSSTSGRRRKGALFWSLRAGPDPDNSLANPTGARNSPPAPTRWGGRSPESGFSLIELTIAAFILLVLAASIVAAGLGSRRQLDYEEVRRRALSIGQERFETLRARFAFDDIVKAQVDTTITFDGTVFTLRSNVTEGTDPAGPDTLDPFVKFVSDTVYWNALSADGSVTVRRRVVLGTYIFGGFLEG
jgi:type II secretory pathway pseudopilin PulG